MLSGALLLGKEESISVFFRKRVGRVLWPFLFWSVIVCAILYWQEGGRSLSGYATSLFTGLVTGGVHDIYWYVYMIIGLYLVTPFLRKIVHHSDNGYLYYLIGLLLSIITASKYFPDVELFSRWDSANVEMLAYFVIGYAIVEYSKHIRLLPMASSDTSLCYTFCVQFQYIFIGQYPCWRWHFI